MLLVQGDERLEKLSPAQYRQRRDAARDRDHAAGYARGQSPQALQRRRRARLLGVGALVAVGVPAYRQAGRIHPQQLHATSPSASADEVQARVAGMKSGAKKSGKS